MENNQVISKSQYLKGLQCPKALWLHCNRPDLKPEVSPTLQHRFDSGHEVGLLAQKCFDGGVEIVEEYHEIDATIRSTQEAVGKNPPAIFEAAACSPDGAYSRIDILKKCRGDRMWDLVEVKSTTSVKDYHIDDMALQRHAFAGAGYDIRKSVLMHLDNQYVKNGPLEVQKLFHPQDCTAVVKAQLAAVRQSLEPLKAVLARPDEPGVPIGEQCNRPFDCDYIPYCWQHVPAYSVYNIFKGDKLAALLTKGILDIAGIPDGFDFTARQAIEIDAVKQNRVHADRDAIRRFLGRLVYPLYFLDYETISPAVPLFDGTRPYQKVPFQFSLHVQQEKGGSVTHVDFLHTGAGDPRRRFVERLINSCGNRGSVVVYNQPFEAGVNQALAESYPEHATALLAVNDRMVDLLIPFRSRFLYHPGMRGSASLKSVLPAIVPDLSYAGLAIADGETASLMYLKALKKEVSREEKEWIYADLLDYCRLDTLAEVRLLETLYRASG
jgi:hypothetical protein